MHRNLAAAAAILGIGPRKLRARLRALGILTQASELASQHRDKGYLFVDTRARWNPTIGTYSHYGVVMVTERGIDWLAGQLGIDIKRPPPDEAA